jgi:glycosyltransferase involved in cell wall biosynthesis
VTKRIDQNSLRICLLTYRGNPRSGGQGVYVKLLSRELIRMGHHVDVWSGPPHPELDPEVGLIDVPSLDLWDPDALLAFPGFSALRDPINVSEYARTMSGEFPEPRTFCARVARALAGSDKQTYDIVHDNQSLGPALLAIDKHTPVVATIHHPVSVDFRIALESAPTLLKRWGVRRWYGFLPMQQKVARALESILTVSEASRTDLAREYGIAEERMRVVGNGINVETFCPRPEIERSAERLLTTLSADTPLKGFAYLLEAFAELRRSRPALELVVIGSLAARSPNLKKLTGLGLKDAVEFTGRVSAERIAEEYARATVAIVPSLYEGFGFPAGEAMACEVPVVSTCAGALPEVVGESGVAGILVEPGSGPCLARAIEDLLCAEPSRRAEMGARGRRRVLENFTWRHAASRTVDAYCEVLDRRAGSTRVIFSDPARLAEAEFAKSGFVAARSATDSSPEVTC